LDMVQRRTLAGHAGRTGVVSALSHANER
jgi:hypothetical protein